MNQQTTERAAPPIARNIESPALAEAIGKLLADKGPMPTRDIRHYLHVAQLGDIPQSVIKRAIHSYLSDVVVRRGVQWGFKEDSRFIYLEPVRYGRGIG